MREHRRARSARRSAPTASETRAPGSSARCADESRSTTIHERGRARRRSARTAGIGSRRTHAPTTTRASASSSRIPHRSRSAQPRRRTRPSGSIDDLHRQHGPPRPASPTRTASFSVVTTRSARALPARVVDRCEIAAREPVMIAKAHLARRHPSPAREAREKKRSGRAMPATATTRAPCRRPARLACTAAAAAVANAADHRE